MRWGKWVVVAAAFFAAGACAPTVPATPVPPRTAPHPLVIVPGIELFCEVQTTDWAAWEDAAVARGYRRDEVVVFRPDPCASNIDSAAGLAQIVDRLLEATGADKVDIVAHSMGSLASRWCIRFSGCGGKVAHMVGVAAANHGTIWANLCPVAVWSRSCGELAPQSSMIAALNADDESWSDVEYATFNSVCDIAIVPYTSTFLDGAINVDEPRCVGHTGWKTDGPTIDWSLDWFAGSTADSR